MKPSIHILLVSAQAAPNLLPTLDPEIKPERVVLLVSSKMQERAESLTKVFRESSIVVDQIALPNEHDLNALEEVVLDIALRYPDKPVAFNLTGGTKLMALVAQSVAATANCATFYIDVDTDEVIWLDRSRPAHKLTAALRLRHYLQSYGFSISDRQHPANPPSFQLLQETLVKNVSSFERPLGDLNFLAQSAQDKPNLQIRLDERQQDSRALEALLRHFEEAGALSVNGGQIRFANESARFFCNGGWLEHHIFQTLNNLREKLHVRDKACNLVVEDRNGVRNELDIAFMARNRLFVIECKTARMDKDGSNRANDTLFKLSEISRRVGGLGTQAMLASFRKLNEPELKLAKALNIRVVCSDQLSRLDEHLVQWAGR